MDGDLSFDLHVLTARLDRAADRILRAELGVPYRRFLALFMIGELDATTQRALAERLGVTEPSVSRMTTVLSEAGLLDARPDPAGGNRRRLRLTPSGEELVQRCRDLLGGRLTELVKRSEVPHEEYTRYTRRLLSTLDAGEETATAPQQGRPPEAVRPADQRRRST